MIERTDLLTASRVDLTLILLPLIGRWETAWALAANDVPLEVAARVLAEPWRRRAIEPYMLDVVPATY
ncbi:hypothetical protein [Massilia sp. TN1-12]|uniref:hypothetical protein n=1 Tax=Massilia paldalensis TaxID=3377675 RepID=UPI00384C91A8